MRLPRRDPVFVLPAAPAAAPVDFSLCFFEAAGADVHDPTSWQPRLAGAGRRDWSSCLARVSRLESALYTRCLEVFVLFLAKIFGRKNNDKIFSPLAALLSCQLSNKHHTASTHGAPHRHARARSPSQGVGPRRQTQRRRRGVAADEVVQVGSSGGEGVSEHPARARGLRRYWCETGGRRVEAGSGDDSLGAHTYPCDCTLQPRVLRGERHPRRARRTNGRRRSHFECGNALFFRGGRRGVCGSPATVTHRDLRCSRDLPCEGFLSFVASAVL